MDEKLLRSVQALRDSLTETPVYREYAGAAEKALADPANAQLLKRYESVQMTLQAAALAGSEPPAEAEEEFGKLNYLLMGNDEIADYLLAKMKFDQLTGSVLEALTEGLKPGAGMKE